MFSTSEDLGGGLKVSGSLAIDNTQDPSSTQNYVNGKGASISLAGGFGTLSGSTVEGGDAVALDSLLALGNGTHGSTITYAAPAINGFSLSVSHKGGNGNIGQGNSDDQNSLMIYGVKYAAGPVAAGVSFLRWNDAGQTSGIKSRDTITASYDMGVAKAGVFYSSQKGTAAATLKNTAYQLSVPMGAVSLGAEYGVKSAAGVDTKGTAISASYALSKRTSISVSAKKWDATATTKAEDNSILLNHSF